MDRNEAMNTENKTNPFHSREKQVRSSKAINIIQMNKDGEKKDIG